MSGSRAGSAIRIASAKSATQTPGYHGLPERWPSPCDQDGAGAPGRRTRWSMMLPAMLPLRFELANGLKVILFESHAAPVVAFQAWVGVGSADETAEEAGIAHVFEHMLFKGTEQ